MATCSPVIDDPAHLQVLAALPERTSIPTSLAQHADLHLNGHLQKQGLGLGSPEAQLTGWTTCGAGNVLPPCSCRPAKWPEAPSP